MADASWSPEELLEEIKRLERNASRLETILSLSIASEVSEEEVRDRVLEAVVELTDSNGGYLHFFNEDSRSIDLVAWSEKVHSYCNAAAAMHYPIEDAGIWADAVRNGEPAIHNEYQEIPAEEKGGLPDGHFPLYRHVSVPVVSDGRVVAIAGIGNKEEPYTEDDVRQTKVFMDSMWAVLVHKKARRVLEQFSFEDGLTGVANRRRFDEAIKVEWRRAGRGGHGLGLLMIDIDEFKHYNDTLGHQEGDRCLQQVAAALNAGFQRAGELVARYGGEEFAILLPGVTAQELEEAAERARQVVEALSLAHPTSERGIVTVSVGAGFSEPEDNPAAEQLVEHTDRNLYAAKRNGRNRSVASVFSTQS